MDGVSSATVEPGSEIKTGFWCSFSGSCSCGCLFIFAPVRMHQQQTGTGISDCTSFSAGVPAPLNDVVSFSNETLSRFFIFLFTQHPAVIFLLASALQFYHPICEWQADRIWLSSNFPLSCGRDQHLIMSTVHRFPCSLHKAFLKFLFCSFYSIAALLSSENGTISVWNIRYTNITNRAWPVLISYFYIPFCFWLNRNVYLARLFSPNRQNIFFL